MATDYEKKYKEALERAKRLTSDMTTLQKIREFIFPELVESEDERITDTIFNCLYQCCDTGFISGTQRDNALAYLEKQKEQKPAEWSEEDEDNLCRVIRVLEDNDSDWKELSNWLKSLRPSWKPSEEQMKALNEIVNTLAASPFFHQNDYLFNILNGLREELKKLL